MAVSGAYYAIGAEMMSVAPGAFCNSNVDIVVKLPRQTGSRAIAEACRETALAFINDSGSWGKAELAMWLRGPYAQLTQYSSPSSNRPGGNYPRPVRLLRDIDVCRIERAIRIAHTEVVETLQRTGDPEGAASFAFAMLSSGFVAPCEDKCRIAGWVPTVDARRLADRVLSLLAVDYLARPADYETEFSVCTRCKAVDFDADIRMRGICARHDSGYVPRMLRSTVPHIPRLDQREPVGERRTVVVPRQREVERDDALVARWPLGPIEPTVTVPAPVEASNDTVVAEPLDNLLLLVLHNLRRLRPIRSPR